MRAVVASLKVKAIDMQINSLANLPFQKLGTLPWGLARSLTVR